MSIIDTAIQWHGAGFTVLPVKTDGTKGPALRTWKEYQTRRPTVVEMVSWCKDAQGIGVLTGTSARLEMLEAEGRAVDAGQLDRLAHLADDSGLGDLWHRVEDGYSEVTPSGGIHWYYTVTGGDMRGNVKLARRIGPDNRPEVMWETRGEGGFSIIAPSAGTTHPTGRGWVIRSGEVADIPTLTADERDALHALVSMLDETPAATEQERAHAAPRTPASDTLRPGDDYNARATWDEILTGWTKVHTMGGGFAWRRPGKDVGISATTNQAADGVDRLFVFSTSTEFESERPYTKFAAYALLQHAGSYTEAARALSAAGYGEPPPAPDLTWLDSLPNATEAPTGLRAVPDPTPRPTLTDELAADPRLADEVANLRRRERAREILVEVRERANPKPAPDCGLISELLARPESDQWRIEGMLPAGGRMLFTAQRKTGKTTAVGNLGRSLVDGTPFLGTYHTTPISGRIAVLNYEVTGATFARWMDDVGIDGDRMYVENLRGCANPLSTEQGRDELVARLVAQGAEILVVDPFGRAYHGKDQNDAAQITPWLVTLDQVAEMAGCTELVLTAHAGWNGERTRGSSALEDWPDVIVTMTKDDHGQRFIRAEGRDVDIDEGEIAYNDQTRTYHATGYGSRKESQERHQIDRLVGHLLDTVRSNPGKGTNALFKIMKDQGVTYTNGIESKVSRAAVEAGLVEIRRGPNNAKLHYPPTNTPGDSGGSEVGPRSDSGASLYRGGTEGGTWGEFRTDLPDNETYRCPRCFQPHANRYGAGGSPLCNSCRDEAKGSA